jgi:hypothetical protein
VLNTYWACDYCTPVEDVIVQRPSVDARRWVMHQLIVLYLYSSEEEAQWSSVRVSRVAQPERPLAGAIEPAHSLDSSRC